MPCAQSARRQQKRLSSPATFRCRFVSHLLQNLRANPNMLLSFDNFVLDTDRRELRGAAGGIHVEPQVFDLLLYFAGNPNRVIPKDELI